MILFVIRIGCFSIEFSDIDSKGRLKFRKGEGLENGTCWEVNVALPKRLAVSAILECFKTRHKYPIFWRGSKVDLTKFGAYIAVGMLMEHCFNQPGITAEDKDVLRKEPSELFTHTSRCAKIWHYY
jgi:hypothetical protein